jgi:glucosamine 6-phosphate synthetase-like amidotransferase/phosphosugar isomerase protein
MCGHIGIVNREKVLMNSEKLLKFFYQGLYCDAVRGQHGTGICAVESDGTYRMFKRALNSSDFLELATTKKIISDNDNVFLMGHNRHATHGSHITENTHPFVNSNVTLFHNGTLTSHNSLNAKKTFSVDSDAISHLLAHSDNKAKSLEELKGAYALVWYDDEDESINFARNSDRTFYLGSIKGSNSLVYASEEGLINWLATRNGIEIDRIEPLEVGKLVSIYLDPTKELKVDSFTPYVTPTTIYSGSSYYTTKYSEIPKIPGVKINDVVLVRPKEWVSYNTGPQTSPNQRYGFLRCTYKEGIYFHMSGVSEAESNKYLDKNYSMSILSIISEKLGYGKLLSELTNTEVLAVKLREIESVDKDKVITIQTKKDEEKLVDLKKYLEKKGFNRNEYTSLTDDELKKDDELSSYDYSLVKGPNGRYISETEFIKKSQGGCSNCSDDILLEDAEKTRWDFEGNPYCPDCASFYNIT